MTGVADLAISSAWALGACLLLRGMIGIRPSRKTLSHTLSYFPNTRRTRLQDKGVELQLLQQVTSHTFPEQHKVRRLRPQEIVRRTMCCQATRTRSKRLLSA